MNENERFYCLPVNKPAMGVPQLGDILISHNTEIKYLCIGITEKKEHGLSVSSVFISEEEFKKWYEGTLTDIYNGIKTRGF